MHLLGSPPLIFRAVSTLLLGGLAGAQGTYLVGGAGADFASLEQALAAAPSGSTLLVRPGVYTLLDSHGVFPHHVVDGKALTLVATDPDAETRLDHGLTVRNLGPDQTVAVLGIDLGGGPASPGPALAVEDAQGTVWVQDARIVAPLALLPGIPQIGGYDAVRAESAEAVHLVRVEARASRVASTIPLEPGAAVVVEGSNVHLFECELVGGEGFGLTLPTGGAAVRVTDGFAYAYRSSLVGGRGAAVGTAFGCAGTSGDGGPALELASPVARAVLVSTTLTGGAPGSFVAPCTSGASGPATAIAGGTLDQVSLASHSMQAAWRASAFAPTPLDFSAPAGTFAWALVASRPDALFVPAKLGVQVVDRATFQTFPIGFVGASGTLSGSLPAAGAGGDLRFVQPFFFDEASQQALLATPTAIARTARGVGRRGKPAPAPLAR